MTTGRSFHIDACLGRGGFGEVYRARLRRPGGFETEVALKVLRADVDPRGQGAERLRDEARMLGLVRHRAIPRVHDLVELDGRLVLISEYVEGEDLSRCLRADPALPPRACVEVAAALSDALHAAWSTPVSPGRTARIVHRDLKPANVRIGRDGGVKLLDFGIAWTDEVTRIAQTQTAALLGSPAYMPPERFDGHPPAPANDVYGVGAVLYEALAGKRLFQELSFRTVAAMVLVEDRFERAVEERFALLPPGLPPELLALLRRLLGWSPASRPSALAAAEALEALAPACPGPSLVAWCRGRRWPERPHADGPWVGRTLTESHDEPSLTAVTRLHTLEVDALEDLTPAPSAPPAWRPVMAALLAGVAMPLAGLGAWSAVSLPAAGDGDATSAPSSSAAPPLDVLVASTVQLTAQAIPAALDPAPAEASQGAALAPSSSEAPAPAATREVTPPAPAAAPSTRSRPARTVRPRLAPDLPDVTALLGADPAPAVGRAGSRPSPSAPAPGPAAAPSPLAEPPAPAPQPVGALVRLDAASQAAAVRLVGDAGTFALPSRVPAGRYRVLAEFTPGVPEASIWVEVPQQGTLSVRCALRSCRVGGG